MKLNSLRPAKGAVKGNKRVGRGQGSGGGGTARRGHKGASSRSGYSRKLGFEGGQMPLQRRLPKFGFNNINRVEYKAINLYVLQDLIDKTGTKEITLGFLYNRGLTSKTDLVKILGTGEIKSAVDVKVNAFSKSAIEAIEKAGGSATVDNSFDQESGKGVQVNKTAKADVKVKKTEAKAVEAPKVESKPKQDAASTSTSVTADTQNEESVKAAAPKKSSKKDGDDLTIVEGIGPKISQLLNEDGIVTFVDLSKATVEQLEAILEKAGPRYNIHNPTTWPQQAGLAAEGKWDELKELQEKLSGGRPE